MIEQYGREYDLMCDECGHTEQGFLDFKEAVKFKKDNRWRLVKIGIGDGLGEWFDLCPSCAAARKEQNIFTDITGE